MIFLISRNNMLYCHSCVWCQDVLRFIHDDQINYLPAYCKIHILYKRQETSQNSFICFTIKLYAIYVFYVCHISLHVERTFDTDSSIGDVTGKSCWKLVSNGPCSVINAYADDNKGKGCWELVFKEEGRGFLPPIRAGIPCDVIFVITHGGYGHWAWIRQTIILDRPELDKRKLSIKIGILPLPHVDIPIMDKADVT